jgi:hypothetical protein
MIVAASYLANKPAGAVLVYLIVAVVLCAVAIVVASWTGRVASAPLVALWRALLAGALGFTILAFLT